MASGCVGETILTQNPQQPSSPPLSVIVPVYNEKASIREILARVASEPLVKEIIVVDDCSQDGTREILQEWVNEHPSPPCQLILHQRNQGKGAAVRSGIDKVAGEIVIIQDADLEYDPREYTQILAPILDGRADVVYGSRFLGGPHRVIYFWHYLGNQILTLFCNLLANLNLSDMETGYKAFRREVLDQLTLRSNSFDFEPEVTMKVARRGFRIYETPISYSGRSYQEGKKITWVDGVRGMWALLRYRFFN